MPTSEARRGFYKALDAFPKAEAPAADRGTATPTFATPSPAAASDSLGSSRETPVKAMCQPIKAAVEPSRLVTRVNVSELKVAQGADGLPVSIGRAVPDAS
jgi:hypothetical protein